MWHDMDFVVAAAGSVTGHRSGYGTTRVAVMFVDRPPSQLPNSRRQRCWRGLNRSGYQPGSGWGVEGVVMGILLTRLTVVWRLDAIDLGHGVE